MSKTGFTMIETSASLALHQVDQTLNDLQVSTTWTMRWITANHRFKSYGYYASVHMKENWEPWFLVLIIQ